MHRNFISLTQPADSGRSTVEQPHRPIRILLVDDQPRVRQGWRMRLALEADMLVVGEAADGAEVMAQVRALQPDVVLMDIEMTTMDGIMAARALTAAGADCAVIIVSIHDTAQVRADALAAGAAAFIGKQEPFEKLLAAIRASVD